MSDDLKLTPKDYADLAIEAGIGSIPYIGGALQTVYFGKQNEIRFKRIEKFYKELNDRLSKLESLPSKINEESKDQLVGIIETINIEVEKSKTKKKFNYFINAYKNLLLHSNKNNLDHEELYVDILSNISKIEIDLLAMYFQKKDSVGRVSSTVIENSLVEGSMNSLANFGLVNKHLEKITIGGGGAEEYNYSISKLGINFCDYILS